MMKINQPIHMCTQVLILILAQNHLSLVGNFGGVCFNEFDVNVEKIVELPSTSF